MQGGEKFDMQELNNYFLITITITNFEWNCCQKMGTILLTNTFFKHKMFPTKHYKILVQLEKFITRRSLGDAYDGRENLCQNYFVKKTVFLYKFKLWRFSFC